MNLSVSNTSGAFPRLEFSACHWRSFALIFAAAAVSGGCGSSTEAPATVPVSGIVTYKDAPLTKGTVTFQPIAGGGSLQRPAQGEIGSDGRYQLGTFETGDGVVPGKYNVLVTSYLNDPTAEEYAEGAKRESAIPEKYSNSVTSGLTKEIPADAAEGIDYKIELQE